MSGIWHMIQQGLAGTGLVLAWSLCGLLCMGGLLLSALSISGTWLVFAAAGLAALLTGPEQFPGGITLIGFLVICIAVELFEWMAASWGVRRRGGSTAAGWMALLGSIGGMILGNILFPILGGLLGMMLGSFSLVYWTENRRLKKSAHAKHIATGAVLASMSVLLVKVLATTTLIVWLLGGLRCARRPHAVFPHCGNISSILWKNREKSFHTMTPPTKASIIFNPFWRNE